MKEQPKQPTNNWNKEEQLKPQKSTWNHKRGTETKKEQLKLPKNN